MKKWFDQVRIYHLLIDRFNGNWQVPPKSVNEFLGGNLQGAIHNCRIPTELIPHTPDGQPVSMNLRCDDTFVEDEHWHRQAQRYSDFVRTASDKRLLLLEFGVGFNTPVIIRFPFEQMVL